MISRLKQTLLTALFLAPALALGAECNPDLGYCPLAPIPQLVNPATGGVDIATFIPALVKLGIGIASGLAVIYIIIGGIQYMSTDAWGGKKDAKKTIQNAIVGLLLTIAAYSILYTINPNLVKFSLEIEGVASSTDIDGSSGITKLSATETGCKNDCVAVDPNNIPIKPYGYACSNNPCYINSSLETKLRDLTEVMKNQGIAWQVTEAFPPTVTHSDPCHKKDTSESGKCVDAALISPSSENIVKFMRSIIANVGTHFEYERCDNNKNNPLLKDPVFAESGPNKDLRPYLKCEGTTTAQHAHIEL